MGSKRCVSTLVKITEKRQAFRPLFKALSPDKRRDLKHRLMREDRPFTDWPNALGAEVDPLVLLEVMERVMVETSSIVLRFRIADIWTRLRSEGLRLALCSNLASDYVTALRNEMPELPDVEVLSYNVGAIKPEPAIYAAVLFVGDTPRTDIEGPRAAGMKAIHVDELVAAMPPG
ncbi:HAD hydrolase-like protein [Roseovarius aestuarii]|nr:HAD hydrolase-like protein [Roseovarius aestuarii]